MTYLKDKVFWLFVLLGAITVFIISLVKTNYAPFWYIDKPIQFFNLIIVAAVVEEIVFRGLLFGLINKKLNVKLTIFCTSLLFSLAHLYYHSPLWALLIFIPGILFGILRSRNAGVIGAISLHLIYNLMYFSLYEF